MTDLLQTYVSAWPGIWVIDTVRYLRRSSADGGHPAHLLAGRSGSSQAAGS